MFTASEVFDLAIQIEVNGENFYRKALGGAHQEQLKGLLLFLADQETKHRDTFERLKAGLSQRPDAGDPIAGATGSALRAAMGRHAFSLDDLESSPVLDEKGLLQTALEFEKDSIQFYEFLATLIDEPSALIAIQEIRGEELEHKDLLMRKIAAL